MAFYDNTNVPRDPSAINQHFNAGSFITGILLLVLLATAIGLYLFVVAEPSLQPTANAPSMQTSPRTNTLAPAPQSQPTP